MELIGPVADQFPQQARRVELRGFERFNAPQPHTDCGHQFRAEQLVQVRRGQQPGPLEQPRPGEQCSAQVIRDLPSDKVPDQDAGEQVTLFLRQLLDGGEAIEIDPSAIGEVIRNPGVGVMSLATV